jgi:TRAP-type C4-dicarboxylate transport system permease small subunit
MSVLIKVLFNRALTKLSLINLWIGVAMRNSAGLLLIAMTVIVLVQILFRYAFNDSLIWTEEVSKTLMVWCAFLIAPWAYRNGANVNITIFTDELPPNFRQSLSLLINLMIIWIIAVFFLESFGMVNRGFLIKTASLPIQVGWFFMVVPLSLGAMLFVGVELLLRDVLKFSYPRKSLENITKIKNVESE